MRADEPAIRAVSGSTRAAYQQRRETLPNTARIAAQYGARRETLPLLPNTPETAKQAPGWWII